MWVTCMSKKVGMLRSPWKRQEPYSPRDEWTATENFSITKPETEPHGAFTVTKCNDRSKLSKDAKPSSGLSIFKLASDSMGFLPIKFVLSCPGQKFDNVQRPWWLSWNANSEILGNKYCMIHANNFPFCLKCFALSVLYNVRRRSWHWFQIKLCRTVNVSIHN